MKYKCSSKFLYKISFLLLFSLLFTAILSSCAHLIQNESVEPVTFISKKNYDGSVTLYMATNTSGASIFYTSDSSIPDSNAFEYTNPLVFIESVTISAIAIKSGMEDSPVSTALISISQKAESSSSDDNSYDYTINLSNLLIKEESEENYIWRDGENTGEYNNYVSRLDLSQTFTSLYNCLPQQGEKVRILWQGKIDKSLSELNLNLIDANTQTAGWGKILSDSSSITDITADKDFKIDYTFTISTNPVEKVILNLFYIKENLDSKITYTLSGLRTPFTKSFTLSSSGGPVVNPHKGYVQYAWGPDAIDNIYSDKSLVSGKNPAWDYCSVVYTGRAWNSIQKGKNEYDWTSIDKELELCAKYGRTMGWRIYPINTSDSSNPDNVPEFIYQEGCKSVQAKEKGTERIIRVPDWSDPIYLQACKDFASEMASRYDGDKRVEFIDIRCFGNWGEWHCYQLEGSEMPSEEIQKEMIAYYASLFKTTQLVIPSDCQGDVYDYALSLGIAKRNDGLIRIKDRELDLKKCYESGLPAIGENCGTYEDLLEADDSDAYNQKWTLERWKSVIEISHMSYYELDRADCGYTFFTEQEEAIKEMNNKIGYNFEVTSASLSYDQDLNIILSVTIKNTGAAPAFFNMNLIADITDSNGNRKFALDGIKEIKKGSFADGAEKTFVFNDLSTAGKKALCEGDSICLGLYEDAQAENPNVKFDNKNNLSNNKLLLGSL
ncbi:MAG: chitobiase/beta-hexosaminidase C-terminal domain-containing protein [Treponema sp.]|nr:chitobiase/beta-hexosaminidase C-terminal domain-containing protein [Treponema sp.]